MPDDVAPRLLRVHPDDDVVVVLTEGAVAPPGHKLAARDLPAGAVVHKSGHPIGVLSAAVVAGEHVHTHNLDSMDGRMALERETRAATDWQPPAIDGLPTTFPGYRRRDGRIGTRNYLLIIPTVNCSVTVARAIAERARGSLPRGVDGVAALAHTSGCGLSDGGVPLERLRRTLRGYADHPNVGGVLVVGLGCEVNQLDALVDPLRGTLPAERLHTLQIQDSGGTRTSIDAGLAGLEALAVVAADDHREDVPLSGLVVGLQCGGSDGFSALSANPALGRASDLLVAAGATVLLSETTELVGAVGELCARAADPGVAEALRERVAWWLAEAERHGTTVDANPSPGNLAGGITTIEEKSIGAASKGGTSPLVDVIGYAERPSRRGLVIMDSPGYDPVSATGQIAGGANLVCFTTGRGSCFGSIPAPALKLSTTSELASRMPEDIDVDCGGALDGSATIDELGERIALAVIAAAGGRTTTSEELGYGLDEFAPWVDGLTL